MASARGELVISEAIKRALSLVTEAMDLLDAHGIAAESAANLAIAQQQLRQLVRS